MAGFADFLTGAGAIAGAAGSFFGGQSQGRAGRKARDWYDRQTAHNRQQMGGLLYGNQNAMDLWASSRFREPKFLENMIRDGLIPPPPEGMDLNTYRNQLSENALKNTIGGPVLPGLRDISKFGEAQGYNIGGALKDQFAGLNQQGNLDLQQVMNLYGNVGQNTRGLFKTARQGVAQQFGRAESTARQFGAGRAQEIRRDFGENRKDLNQATDASLAGLGVNTLRANQRTANERLLGREESRALTDLGDIQTQLVMNPQMQQAQAMTGLYGQEASIMPQIGLAGAGASQQIRQANLARQLSQTAQLAAQGNQNLNRNIGLRQLPYMTALNAQGGSVMNPWLGQNTAQYYPGFSPAGSALSAFGQFGGQLGGALLGKQLGLS